MADVVDIAPTLGSELKVRMLSRGSTLTFLVPD